MAIETLYIEREIAEHPRTLEVCERLPKARRILCDRYGEIFNRNAQNFRLQKNNPALILANKRDKHVLETPEGLGIGGEHNFYFSHMLNCVYDCSYCFLQGMFRSANYLLFVNFEDFQDSIRSVCAEYEGETWFFSGYDCDSLAMESLTGFAKSFIPFFESLPGAKLELRTKSLVTASLLAMTPIENCVVASSFTPAPVSQVLEGGVPPVQARLAALARLQDAGWPVGLRFDPLIYFEGYRDAYRELLNQAFAILRPETIHSVSFGPLRLPREVFKRMVKLSPRDKLLAGPLEDSDGLVSYRRDIEYEMRGFVEAELGKHISESIFFPCEVRA